MPESLKSASFFSRLQEAQRLLGAQQMDGWLLYDFHGNNPLTCEFGFIRQMSTCQ